MACSCSDDSPSLGRNKVSAHYPLSQVLEERPVLFDLVSVAGILHLCVGEPICGTSVV